MPIQQIAWFVLLTLIHWIAIYPVDSVICVWTTGARRLTLWICKTTCIAWLFDGVYWVERAKTFSWLLFYGCLSPLYVPCQTCLMIQQIWSLCQHVSHLLATTAGFRVRKLAKMTEELFYASYPFNDLQGDGITSSVFPLRPCIKSDHFITFPSPDRHDFDDLSISSADNTWSHTFKFVIIPLKDWSGSNTPGGSCSIPSTKDPLDLIM